jgi:hypothetical protein
VDDNHPEERETPQDIEGDYALFPGHVGGVMKKKAIPSRT